MAKPSAINTNSQRKRPPATTPEARESQLVSLAINLAEQQLRDHTASSQVLTHFLKLGSRREQIENDILLEQKKLIVAKTKAIQSGEEMKEAFLKAEQAMSVYSGETRVDRDD